MPDFPINPPLEWFGPPEEGIPVDRRITIEASGRTYGYIAMWNTCHVGIEGCVRPPKGSPSDYEYAHQGETMVASGELIRTAVIGGGAGHAPADMKNMSVPQYYENSGTQLMRVRYGEDEHGLWFAGALWPDVAELQVAQIRASSLSGDWRWHAAWRRGSDGSHDFAGSCLVNIPGFPMRSDSSVGDKAGRPYAIAASMGPYVKVDEDTFVIYEDNLAAGALPYKASKKADPDTAWDGPAIKASADGGKPQYRKIYAWVNPEGDPDSKSSYKLPHHLTDGTVVLRGVQAAMARLMQSTTQIPESDRKAVYNHLAKHYKQFGETPPEFRAATDPNPDTASATPKKKKNKTYMASGVEMECDGTCSECTCGVVVEETPVVEEDLTADAMHAVESDVVVSAQERIAELEYQVATLWREREEAQLLERIKNAMY